MERISTASLCLLRSLQRPVSAELIDIMLARSGAARADLEALLAGGHVALENGAYVLTKTGFRFYAREKRGRYF